MEVYTSSLTIFSLINIYDRTLTDFTNYSFCMIKNLIFIFAVLFLPVSNILISRILFGAGFHRVVALIPQSLFSLCHGEAFIGIKRTVNKGHGFGEPAELSFFITGSHCKNRRESMSRIAERSIAERTYARVVRPHMRLRINCYKVSLTYACFDAPYHFFFLFDR